jgi:hypothetical protein
VIVFALPALGLAALCDQIRSAEQAVERLRDGVRTLRADVAAKKQRLENVRSWMPDAGARQRLTEGRTAYEAAKASLPALRDERQQIERRRLDALHQKQDLLAEKARIETARADMETLEHRPEVQKLQRKLNDHEAFVLSQLGASPTSVAEAKAMAGRVIDISHIVWLQADDLSIFARAEFEGYQPPSYTGRDRSRLWALENNLAQQVRSYGGAGARSPEATHAHSAIKLLVEQIRGLRTKVASRLADLAAGMGSLQEAIKRTGGGIGSSGRPGYETGFLSEEARGQRIAELEPRIAALQETEDRLTLELEEKTRALSDIGRLQRELRGAEKAVQRADQEVREADRRDLAEAQGEFDEASDSLAAAQARLPIASREMSRLRRLLNEKMAGINTVIAEAKPISQRATGDTGMGRAEQCRDLRSHHQGDLGVALEQYEEEGACLSAALPGIPAEIQGLIVAIEAVDCGAGAVSRSVGQESAPVPERADGEPPILAGACGPEPPEGRTYVPAVANTGMAYQQAIVAVRLAGLRGSAFKAGHNATSRDTDGPVTTQKPAPCTLVPLGTTVQIGYGTATALREPPSAQNAVSR